MGGGRGEVTTGEGRLRQGEGGSLGAESDQDQKAKHTHTTNTAQFHVSGHRRAYVCTHVRAYIYERQGRIHKLCITKSHLHSSGPDSGFHFVISVVV